MGGGSWPQKPKLPPEVMQELEMLGLDELRRIWQTPRAPSLTIRNKNIARADLEAWIRWGDFREKLKARVMFGMTFIAMVASVIAAVEGWPWAVP